MPAGSAPGTDGHPTFVFVHGAACNSRIWGPLQRELALLGHRSLALDLPGYGAHAHHPAPYYRSPQDLEALAAEPSAQSGVTLADWQEHVVDTVRRVAEHGPVVLVGTSAGGAALNVAGNAAPELVDRLVYVSAWCCVGISTLAEGTTWPEQRANLFSEIPFPVLGDPATLGFVRSNLRDADPELFARMKAATLADATDDRFRELVDLMEPDVNIAVGTEDCRVRAETWGTIPRSYVRLTEDRSITLAAQDRMIAEADALTPDNPFDVHSVDTSHAGYFHRPAEFATLLAALA